MRKISRDGYNQLIENVKQPLEHLYDKLEGAGVFTSTGANEVYDSIYKFLESVEEWVEEEHAHSKRHHNVTVDGDEYRKVGS